MKFRLHASTLADSMLTVVEIKDAWELWMHLLEVYPLGLKNNDCTRITVEPYCYDPRIGWDTHIVSLPGVGVLGYTSVPLRKEWVGE